jgi:hypothetical protein
MAHRALAFGPPRPEVLSERIYPSVAYKLKDTLTKRFRLLRKIHRVVRHWELVKIKEKVFPFHRRPKPKAGA